MSKLREDEIKGRLQAARGWDRIGDMLVRTWQFASARRALEFVQQVGATADRVGHYPEIILCFRTVRVELNSRADGGLTDQDFRLAEELNTLPDDR